MGSLDRTIGSDQVDTAQVRRVLGGAYLELKRYTEARAAAEAALPVLSARFGPTHRTVFATRVDLAQIRGEQGDVDGAIADLQTIIREREEAHGRDHFQLVGDYYWLRHFAEVARRWDLAVGAAERALEIARKAHGPDSPILADAAADVMKMKMWAILAKTKRR